MKKMKMFFVLEFLARSKTEREIREARQNLDRVEQTYSEVTAFRTTLEKEIGIYRELLESKY